QDVARERFRLTPLLGTQARVCAGRVDERDDRGSKLRGKLHQTKRLPVPLRMWHTEVALEILLGVPPLLMSNDHRGHTGQPRPATDDCRVVAKQSIAVELDEIGEDGAQVVERVRAARVAGDHDALHWRQALIDLRPELLE